MTESDDPVVRVLDRHPKPKRMRDDLLAGLRRSPKMLPSLYLYDETGAELFDQICETDDYYVTRTETKILRDCGAAMAERIGERACIVEPGSGSGQKTRLLLSDLQEPAAYVPIDIAGPQLESWADEVASEFPEIEVLPVCADFMSDFSLPRVDGECERVVTYFPGSTIGNFSTHDAQALLRRIAALSGPGGGVLIGVDLKKNRDMLEAAYDDSEGVSAAFALNVLERMNREMDADFDAQQFEYEAVYNESQGRIEMGLVSRRKQVVEMGGTRLQFEAGERVLTEVSHKYDIPEFGAFARKAGLEVEQVWTDTNEHFSVQYLGVPSEGATRAGS